MRVLFSDRLARRDTSWCLDLSVVVGVMFDGRRLLMFIFDDHHLDDVMSTLLTLAWLLEENIALAASCLSSAVTLARSPYTSCYRILFLFCHRSLRMNTR